jgi:hypothetical protein
MNREEYLEAAIAFAAPKFKAASFPLPTNVRAGCGHMGSGLRAKNIGECWSSSSSEDGGREIWIRPDQTDTVDVLGILVHELCHAALPAKVGHKKPFKDLGTVMHLQGKPTEMSSGSAEFLECWSSFIEKNGDYPQPKFLGNLTRTTPKQTTRMVKVTCSDEDNCGMVFRTSRKWLEGPLDCPRCGSYTTS